MDIGATAKSFFLYKMPYMNELKDSAAIESDVKLATDKELEQWSKVTFRNKNQEKMISEKVEREKSKSKFLDLGCYYYCK